MSEERVYFIQGEKRGLIKIGVSIDTESRVRELQVGHPVTLRVLASVKGGAELEAKYHAQFAKDRVRGEWFRQSPELMAEINRCRQTPQLVVDHAGERRERLARFADAIKDIPARELAEAAHCSIQGVGHWRTLERFPSGETLLDLMTAFPQVWECVRGLTGHGPKQDGRDWLYVQSEAA